MEYAKAVTKSSFYPNYRLTSPSLFTSKHTLACTSQMQYKQFPFAGCTIAFLGFTEEEEEHMRDIATKTGEEGGEGSGPTYVRPCGLFRTYSPELCCTVCLNNNRNSLV